MDQVAIGARIKAARERVHLTQEQLAEIIDISPTHMSVIERGVKTPKLDTFVRIANALGVSTDALLQDVVVPANESTQREKDQFKAVCNQLLSRTYIVRTLYKPDRGRVANPDYT